jgi:preprotein translocase subunit SecG
MEVFMYFLEVEAKVYDICENASVLKALLFALSLINLVKIMIPILLILMASVDLGRSVLSGDNSQIEKIKKTVMNRFLAAVIVFFVPAIIGLSITVSRPILPSPAKTCMDNANMDTIRDIESRTPSPGGNDNPGGGGTTTSTGVKFTVATWNLHRVGYAASKFAEKIKPNNIDIIGFQEIQKGNTNEDFTRSLAKKLNMDHYKYKDTPAGDAIISKRGFITTRTQALVSCHEDRALIKTVVNVNGKNISFYNVHLSPEEPPKHRENCPKKQMEDVYKKIKNDTNPVILVGDFNVGFHYNIINDALGSDYTIVANDIINGTAIYTDSIILKKNMGISFKSSKIITTRGTITDHNMVIATFEIKK